MASCPAECRCHDKVQLSRVSSPSDESPLWTGVDCSNASLERLPERLPENTRTLDVSHNEVQWWSVWWSEE